MKTLETINQEFNTLMAKKQELAKQIQEIDAELLRLQGEYRVIDSINKESSKINDVLEETKE